MPKIAENKRWWPSLEVGYPPTKARPYSKGGASPNRTRAVRLTGVVVRGAPVTNFKTQTYTTVCRSIRLIDGPRAQCRRSSQSGRSGVGGVQVAKNERLETLEGTLNVAIVDDCELLVDVLRDLIFHNLNGRSWTSESFEDLTDAIRLGHRFDLILLDYNLPDLRGLDGLAQLIKLTSVPVALLSGGVPHGTVCDAIELGACGYIPKSLPPRLILEGVDAMVGGQTFAADHYLKKMQNAFS